MTATDLPIPEELLRLAYVLGATDVDGNPDLDFFAAPHTAMAGIVTDAARRGAAFELLAELMSDTGIEAPELPGSSGGWTPLLQHSAGIVTGALGVLHTESDADGDPAEGAAATHLDLGVGGRLTLRPDDLDLTVQVDVRVPVVRIQHTPTLDAGPPRDGDGVELRVDVDLSGVASSSLASIDGVALVLLLPYSGAAPDLSIVLRGVRFGDAPAIDLTPQQLVDELGTTGVRMVVALLQAQVGSSPELAALLRLLGLDLGDASNPATPTIPAIPVDDLLARGVDALRDWLDGIVRDTLVLRHWVQTLGDLLGLDTLAGTGTVTDPLRLCVGADPADTPQWHACVTLVVTSDPVSGALVLVPGLRADLTVAGPPRAQLAVQVDLARLALGATPSASAIPLLTATAVLGADPADPASPPLLDDSVTIGGTARTLRVGRVAAGLALEAGAFVPVLALHDVAVGTDLHPVLDLTSVDALAEVATDALSQVVDLVLDLLGAGDATAPGRALAALAGLVEPTDAGAGWPALVGLPELFSDPLTAIGCYHARVLGAPPDAGGANRWAALAAEVGVLLTATTGTAAPTVAGLGTTDEPWTLPLFVEPAGAGVGGSVTATLWAHDPPEGATEGRGPVLELAVATAPLVPPLAGVQLELAWQATILRLGLPSGTPPCTGGVDLHLAPRHELTVAVRPSGTPSLSVGVRELQVQADAVRFALAWEDGQLSTSLDVDDPRAGAFGTTTPLDTLLADLAERLTQPDLGGMPWDALERQLLLPALAWFATLADAATAEADRLADGAATAAAAARHELAQLRTVVRGAGTHADPWAIALDDGGADLLAWLDPDGPSAATLAALVGDAVETAITGALGVGGALATDVLGRALTDLATLDRRLADLLAGRDVAALLAQARTVLADTDGVLTRVAQAAAGWTTHDLTGAHLGCTAAFDPAAILPGVDPTRHLYVVVAAAGLAPWAAQAADRVIDLTLTGVPPEAVDVGGITGPGPWFVVLPDRIDAAVTQPTDHPAGPSLDGFTGQVGRLRRAVAALADTVGGDVAVIAHGTAGHAAQAVAAAERVSHLVTVATSHVDPGGMVVAGAEDAVRLLAGLLDLAGDAVDGVDAAADLVTTGVAVLDGWARDAAGAVRLLAVEAADFVPPALPPIAPAVQRIAVRVAQDADVLASGIVATVRGVLARVAAGLGDGPGRAPTHLGLGLRLHRRDLGVGPGGVRIDADVRLDLAELRLPTAPAATPPPRPTPHATLDLRLHRGSGWLLGGPGAGARIPGEPRVRRIDVQFVTTLAPPATGRLRFVLHDAGVLGESHARWVLDDLADLAGAVTLDAATDLVTGLTGPARELLQAAVAEVLAALPEGVATTVGDAGWQALREVLLGLGLLRARLEGDLRGPGLELPTDVLEHWLVDATAELAAVLAARTPQRQAVLDALRTLLGAGGSGDDLVLTTAPGEPPLELVLHVGAVPLTGGGAGPTTVTLRTVGDGLDLGPLGLAGAVAAGTDGRLTSAFALGTREPVGPLGHPTLAATFARDAAPTLSLALTGATTDPLDGPLALLPPPDPAALAPLLLRLVPPAAASLLLGPVVTGSAPLRTLVTTLTRAQRAALGAAAPPDLTDVGAARRVLASVLFPLLTDPQAALVAALGSGTAATPIASLPDALRAITDARAAALGTVTGAAADARAQASALVDELRARAVAASADVVDTAAVVALPLVPGSLLGAAGRTAALASRGLPTIDAALVRDLVEVVRGLLGAPGAAGSALALPWGAAVRALPTAPGLELTWTLPVPAGAATVVPSATLGLRLDPGLDVAATFTGGVAVSSAAGSVGLTLGVDDTGEVTLAIVLDADGAGGQPPVTVTLLPHLSGLEDLAAGLAGQAVTALLPLVLDELDDVAVVGPVLVAFGNAFGLRPAGAWDAAQLAAFATPVSDLPTRLLANRAGVATALRDLLDLVLDAAGSPTGSGILVNPVGPVLTATVWEEGVAAIVVSLDLAGTSPELCLSASGVPIVGPQAPARPPALTADLTVCVSEVGLVGLAARVEVTDPDWFDTGALVLLPTAAVRLGSEAATGPAAAAGDRVEVGTWFAAGMPRTGVVAVIGLDGSVAGACRTQAADGSLSDDADVAGCIAAIAATTLVPLLLDLVLPELESLLDRTWRGAKTFTDRLEEAGFLRDDGAPADPPRLAPGALDLDQLGGRVIGLVTGLFDGVPIPGTDPVELSFVKVPGAPDRYGVRVGLSAPLTLVDGDDVRLSLVSDLAWLPGAGVDDGITFLVLSMAGTNLDSIDFAPDVAIGGVGLRVDGGEGTSPGTSAALLEDPLHLGGVELSFAYVRAFTAGAPETLAIRLAVDQVGIPLSSAGGGDNPTASKVLASGSPEGSTEPVAPTLSPELVVTILPDLDLAFRLRDGSLPLWLPIQRTFGPIYLEQVGLEAEDLDGDDPRGLVLVDGGLTIDALKVGVDDLGVSIPLDRPLDLKDWQVVLRGLAIAYDGGAVQITGGFREIGNQYAGMVQIQVAQYGITAVGAYGEFPIVEGSAETFTSMFVFGALSAPLGGPPAFFLTGIGAGFGLNRRLNIPDEVTEVIDFTLVKALDSSSGFAENPMASLDALVNDFPVEQGTYWLAAGIRATSFALVEEVVVLAVEFGNGLEINLLGLARAQLPNAALTLASVELALRARFSEREMLLSVQAQLTDNSWVLHESIRLTGGFAFVVWFGTGDFVFTLGGYHPRFAKPDAYPDVPRLGFSWDPGAGLVVKGEAYFALTSSCVMAGARIEAGYELGIVWASFTAGADAILSWDPFFYEVNVYVRVSAGVRWKICLFGACAKINLSFSIGADLLIKGPDLWGKATLDLDVVSVSVTFGALAKPPPPPPLPWAEFHAKHLQQGDPADVTMQLNVVEGLLAPDPATSSTESKPADGSAARPFVVAPELVVQVTTRTASTSTTLAEGTGTPAHVITHAPAGGHLGIRPMQLPHVEGVLVTTITPLGGGANVDVGGIEVEKLLGNVPAGVWRHVPRGDEDAENELREALVGATLVLRPQIWGGDNLIDLSQVDIGSAHPLPLRVEALGRGRLLDQLGLVAHLIDPAAARHAADIAIAALATARTGPSAFARRANGAQLRTIAGTGVAGDTAGRPADAAVGARRAGATAVTPRLAPLGADLAVEVTPVAPRLTKVDIPDRVTAPGKVPARRLEGLVQLAAPAVTKGAVAVDLPDDLAKLVAVGKIREVAAPRLADLDAPAHLAHVQLRLAADAQDTRTAGTGPVLARGRARSAATSELLDGLTDAVSNGGAALPAGTVASWQPGDASRVLVQGDQHTRVLALDAAGGVLAEASGTRVKLALPEGTARVVTVGSGQLGDDTGAGGRGGAAAPNVARPAGLAGWLETTPVVRVARATLLAPGALVQVTGHTAAAHTVGTLTAGAAIGDAASVATRLPASTRAIAIVLETTDPDAGEQLAAGTVTGLVGAARADAPPLVRFSENRVTAVHAVIPADDADAVTLTVDSDARWRLVGVVASDGTADDLDRDLQRTGGAALLAPLVAAATGSSTVQLA